MTDNPEDLVDVEIELSDEHFLQIAKMAHENDITINQQIVLLLKHGLDRIEDILQDLKEEPVIYYTVDWYNPEDILAPPLEYTKEKILEEYWPFWSEKMIKKYGEGHELITEDNCIDDWCAVNWAWTNNV